MPLGYTGAKHEAITKYTDSSLYCTLLFWSSSNPGPWGLCPGSTTICSLPGDQAYPNPSEVFCHLSMLANSSPKDCIPNIKALTGSQFLPNLGSGLAGKATKCEDTLGRGQESVSPGSRPKVFRLGSVGEGAAHGFLCHRAGDFAGAQRTRPSREDDKVWPQRQGSKTPSSKGLQARDFFFFSETGYKARQ